MANDIEQRLTNHDLAISQLEANTKWLYKYGGVGGKGGKGSDSSDGSNYNIYCEFDNIPVNNKDSKIYSAGKHKLKVTITKHGGLSYNVKPIVQSQTDSSNTINANPSSAILSLETTYSKEFTLTINENSNIIISVTSSDGEPKSFMFSIITNPYIFELTYNRDNGNPYNVTSMNNSELMINDLSTNGFNITLNYNIGIKANISYITKSTIQTINGLSGDITNTSGKIKFTIDKSFLIYENSGLYNFNIILTIKEENNLPYEYPVSCSFFLIPSTLFLLIYPEDDNKTIYYSSDGSEPKSQENIPLSNYFDEYNTLIEKESLTEEETIKLNYIKSTVSYSNNGIVGLVGKIYFGGNQQRIFTLLNDDGSSIKVYPNDSEEPEHIYLSFTSVTERKAFNFAPYINNINKNKLVFTIKDNNQIQYEFVYYIYTSQESATLTWVNKDIVIDKENYWRNGIATQAFNTLNGKSYIDTYTNSLNDIILTSSLDEPSDNVDLFISLGIQYNSVNNDDKPIITISSNSNDLVIYQNKITYLGQTCKIYIPKEENYNQGLNNKYHLLTISLRKISYASNDTYYQFIVYIDGAIEGAFVSYLTTIETFNSIKFNPSNVSLNLIELTYFGNTITNNKRQFTESDIDRYWYSYCENYGIQNSLYNSNTLKLLDIFKNINYTVESNNLYSLQNAQITEIAQNVDIPVMIMSISTTTNIGALASYGGDVLTWFTTAANDTTPTLQVDSIYWSPGKADFKKYKLSDYSSIQGAYWYIEIQGSSTKGRKVKNLNLGIHNNGDKAVLFTPNFKKITSSMQNEEQMAIGNSAFLPEQLYTLKADIVDSSHCNNVSIGKFVNDTTPKFSNAQQSNSKYNQYIKNCLTGFPFLLFFEIQNNEDNEYYYVGIYNFNLGRKSYFNLGYNSFDGLDNYIENVTEEEKGNELSEGFGIYLLDDHYTQHIKSLFVTEIQSGSIQNQTHEGGGGNVYDFSQFNTSILGIDGKNAGMFGDFENDTTISANLTITLPKFVKSIAKAGAYIFMSLKKNIDSDILTSNLPIGDYNVGYSRSLDNTMTDKYVSINHVPDFLLEAYRDNDTTGHPVYFRKPNDPLYQGILKDANINFNFNTYLDGNHTTAELLQDLLTAIPKTTETGWLETSILEIIGKIEDEFDTQEVPLDYTSLVWYYVICMAMGLVDSVCKNLNLKSWNASGDSLGKMYTAFYDMDTALGRDNFGRAVSYFAFSDYWTNNFSTSGVNEIDPITIYRDFFPLIDDNSEIIGYDIPSSYLFAIAKYAQLFINPVIWKLNGFQSPQDIWYDLRNYQNGKLRNAQHFIDTYFNNDIKKIPEILINYNYRFKYFWNQETSFNSDELGSFHGKGVYSLKEWLSNRLHILDLYFNLCAAKDFIQYYDESDNTWKNINNQLTELASSKDINILSNQNSDVLIFKNAFATENQITKSSISNIILTVKAPELSPFVIITDPSTENKFVYRYLLNNPDKYYQIHTTNNGSQETIFGGSVLWTEIQEAGYFIDNNTLNCNSVNLDYLKSTLGTCSTYNLNTPSLHTLILNNSNYTGEFEISRTSGKLPNINYLDLSQTSMSKINIINSNIQYIYITGANINELNIRDCKNIQKIDLSNSTFNTINIQYPWILQDNILNLSNTRFNSINIGESTIDGNIFNEIVFDDSGESSNEGEIINKKSINAFNTKKLTINSFKHLKSLIISPDIIEELRITNSDLQDLVEPENTSINNYIYVETISHMTDDGKTVIDKRILHLENLTKLKAISFENTLGFDRIILPNNDIELLAKAFYETDIKYINFADNLNDNHKLILCSENNECSIFYNSSFTLSSDDIKLSDLSFSVKNKLTSLEKLFRINRRYDTLGVHNGTPLITYSKIQRFIKNLENKQYVTNFDYACDRQSLIIADYQINDNIYIANGNIDITQNNSRISFDGYTHLKSLQGTFEHTYIKFFDDVLFSGTFASDLEENETINILNVLPYDSLNKMHINALQNIKTKIESFMFDGDDNGQSRSVYSLALSIYNTGGELNQINVHDLLFVHHNNNDSEYNLNLYKDECIKLTMLSGFKINSNQKTDINGLFTAYEQSITNIHDSFTNLDQSENGSLVDITNFNLQKLKNLSILYNSFVGKIGVNRQLDNNKTIDILHYLDWTLQYSMLQSYIQYYNVFNFYKHVNLITEQDKTDWDNFWKSIMATISENNIVSVNYLLSQCIFNMNNGDSLKIPYYSNSIVYANGLFANSQCYVNNENTGFILSDTTLRGLYNVAYIDNMFDGCTLNGTQNYPLPVNLLSPLSNLKSCIEMFSNTKIKGTNKTYIGENSKLVYYYQKFDNIRWNYTCTDSYIISKKIYDTFEGYPFIPPTFFSRNTKLENIKGIFSNSDFEGYIPDNLLLDYLNRPLSQLKNISNFVYNCKILPQKYYKFTNADTVNILLDNITPKQNITTFTFIPENFIREGYDLLNNIDIFNFKLLGSGNPECRLYLFTNNSISKFIPNINLCIDNESRIVNNWYKIDDITNPYEHAKPVYDTYLGYINICINKKDDNIYSEGLTMNMWNMVAISQSALIDPYLASIYYGYIFEPGTLLYNINSAISSNKYFVHTITDLTKPNSQDRTDLIMSPNLLLPGIIYYTTVNPDAFPNYYKNVPKDQIKNKYAYECLFKVNKESSVINISHFDMSFIDIMINSDNIDINYNENIETYICTIHYNTFEYTKYYKNIESSLVKNQFINDCRNDLKQLVYNNYYLLFDKYSDIIFSMGNDNIGTGNLAPYYSFRIDNDTDSSSFIYITSIDDPNQYVRRMYNVTGYMGDYGIIASVENPT